MPAQIYVFHIKLLITNDYTVSVNKGYSSLIFIKATSFDSEEVEGLSRGGTAAASVRPLCATVGSLPPFNLNIP